jgi:hypothetical protein
MNPFMRAHFWVRRVSWRARTVLTLLVRLALLGLVVVLLVQVGQILVTVAVALAAAVALVFILGAFAAEWRKAGVRIAQQYRRLARPLSGKAGYR